MHGFGVGSNTYLDARWAGWLFSYRTFHGERTVNVERLFRRDGCVQSKWRTNGIRQSVFMACARKRCLLRTSCSHRVLLLLGLRQRLVLMSAMGRHPSGRELLCIFRCLFRTLSRIERKSVPFKRRIVCRRIGTHSRTESSGPEDEGQRENGAMVGVGFCSRQRLSG